LKGAKIRRRGYFQGKSSKDKIQRANSEYFLKAIHLNNKIEIATLAIILLAFNLQISYIYAKLYIIFN
jgi:hypothetical protein